MSDNLVVLDKWRATALEQWTDSRILSVDELDAVVWFFQHSYADFGRINAKLDGFSFREKGPQWVLVLKMEQDGIRRVGFVNGSTPIRCIQKLQVLVRSDEWPIYPDRYA